MTLKLTRLGHSRLPAECPVCEHSPISADDCKPNKSLRTTIKVFLRTAEKKREQAKDPTRNALKAPTETASPRVADQHQQTGPASTNVDNVTTNNIPPNKPNDGAQEQAIEVQGTHCQEAEKYSELSQGADLPNNEACFDV